jgi:peptidoglycan hydrolase CwlO-like protein
MKTKLTELAPILLTLIAMLIGCAIWATSAHADIKDWTAEQDFVTKTELKEVIKEQYARQEDVVRLEEKLESLNEKHQRLLEAIDKLDKKLEKTYIRRVNFNE